MVNLYPLTTIPIIGGTVWNVGKLYDIMATPCATDLSIWVEGFFAYAPVAIWAVIEPQPDDVLVGGIREGLAAGKLVTGRRHSVKRRGRVKVKEYHFKKRVKVPGVIKLAWRFVGWERLIGNYLIIADATTEFLVNWTSMAYALSGCQIPGAPYQELTRVSDTPVGVGYGTGWTLVGGYDRATGYPYPPAPPAVGYPARTPFAIGGSVENASIDNPISGARISSNNGDIINLDRIDNEDGSYSFSGWDRRTFGELATGQYILEVLKTTPTTAVKGQTLQMYAAMNPDLEAFKDWSHFVEGAKR